MAQLVYALLAEWHESLPEDSVPFWASPLGNKSDRSYAQISWHETSRSMRPLWDIEVKEQK